MGNGNRLICSLGRCPVEGYTWGLGMRWNGADWAPYVTRRVDVADGGHLQADLSYAAGREHPLTLKAWRDALDFAIPDLDGDRKTIAQRARKVIEIVLRYLPALEEVSHAA